MEKLLNSLRAHCLSQLHSEPMDGQATEPKVRRTRSLCQVVPCLPYQGLGGPWQHPTASSFIWILTPTPSMECGLLREAEPFWRVMVTGGSQEQKVREKRRLALLWQCEQCALLVALPWGKEERLPTERLQSHSHFTSWALNSQAHHLQAFLCNGVDPQCLRRWWTTTVRQNQSAVSYKKGIRTVGFQKQI